MLNTLLDINQIEAGTVRAEIVGFPINDLLDRLRDEFAYHAQARKGLPCAWCRCGLSIHSDPRLLEQMIRNLLSNALKYTERGKVLLGCRRRGGMLSIEVWDTGVGIPAEELQAIFEEYHQLDNAARERSRGLGLGLSIVQRLGEMLGHRVRVRSRPGKGSVFAIEVALAAGRSGAGTRRRARSRDDAIAEAAPPHRRDPGRRGRSRSARTARTPAQGRRPSHGGSGGRRRGAGDGRRGARSGPTSSSPTTICRTA